MSKANSIVDVFELARHGFADRRRTLTGEAALSGFTRLLEGLPAQPERKVTWSLAGDTDTVGRRYLTLQAQAEVNLECQRCLALFEQSLQVESRLQLVATEAELEAEENEDDPDAPDLVLGSARFDVLSLVEDELILALPYVPKHEVCPSLPDALETDESSDTGRPSPFAVLAALKKD